MAGFHTNAVLAAIDHLRFKYGTLVEHGHGQRQSIRAPAGPASFLGRRRSTFCSAALPVVIAA
jgi:hypothetical protein